jgi:hypothetical protein
LRIGTLGILIKFAKLNYSAHELFRVALSRTPYHPFGFPFIPSTARGVPMGESAKYGIYPNANEVKISVMGRIGSGTGNLQDRSRPIAILCSLERK